MNLNKYFWKNVLFYIKDKAKEGEKNPYWTEILSASNVKEIVCYAKDYPYSDIVWDIAEKLSKIDLTKNEKLESLFFTYWNQIDYNNKLTTYKGNDAKEEDKYFFKDFVKEYFIKKIIEYPSVSELYKFRKDISQDELKIALKNIFNNTKFFKMNNQRKEDYWENHIKGNEPNKLLDLIEISGLEKDDLIKWNKIGFLNDIRQLRFDKLLNQNKIDLIKSEGQEVYLITIDINALALLEIDEKLGQIKLKTATNYINILLEEGIQGEKLHENSISKKLQFLIKDKNEYQQKEEIKNTIINWIENNTNIIIEKVKEGKDNKTLQEIRREMQDLLSKITLQNDLERKLKEKGKTAKNKKL